jgi:hypothetical protein
MAFVFNCKIVEKLYPITCSDANVMTIWAVKTQLYETSKESKPDMTAALMRFIYKGKVLKNDQKVNESGIKEGECILVMKSQTEDIPTTAATTASVEAPVNQFVAVPQFHTAMHLLLSSIPDTGTETDTDTAALAAITLLCKVCANIINNPMQDKYRKLPNNSKAYQSKLGYLSNSSHMMTALGFELIGEEWQLVPSADKWNVLLACQFHLERFKDKLTSTRNDTTAAMSTSDADSATKEGSESTDENMKKSAEHPKDVEQQVLLMAALALAQQGQSSVENGKDDTGSGNEKESL